MNTIKANPEDGRVIMNHLSIVCGFIRSLSTSFLLPWLNVGFLSYSFTETAGGRKNGFRIPKQRRMVFSERV